MGIPSPEKIPMIARIWQGVTTLEQADAYAEYLNESGVAGLQNAEGNRGAYVLRRVENGAAHFMVVSFWDTVESVKKFAGGNPQLARRLPRDKDFHMHLDPDVTNYEVLV
jgi:heme-degrading monooxygenase HmoA